jgi:hypothetical protein
LIATGTVQHPAVLPGGDFVRRALRVGERLTGHHRDIAGELAVQGGDPVELRSRHLDG